MNTYRIIKKLLVTERSNLLKEKENKYVFMVERKATKGQIKNAIKDLFNVDVEKINTMNFLGKLRRMGRYAGYRPAWKKAIIKLKSGQEIKIAEESR